MRRHVIVLALLGLQGCGTGRCEPETTVRASEPAGVPEPGADAVVASVLDEQHALLREGDSLEERYDALLRTLGPVEKTRLQVRAEFLLKGKQDQFPHAEIGAWVPTETERPAKQQELAKQVLGDMKRTFDGARSELKAVMPAASGYSTRVEELIAKAQQTKHGELLSKVQFTRLVMFTMEVSRKHFELRSAAFSFKYMLDRFASPAGLNVKEYQPIGEWIGADWDEGWDWGEGVDGDGPEVESEALVELGDRADVLVTRRVQTRPRISQD